MEVTQRQRLPLLILAAVLLFNAIVLWPDLDLTRLTNNDDVSHFTLTQGMVEAVEHGRNPLDFWSPEGVFGYPEIRTYQPLAHAVVAALYFALGKTVSLMTVYSWVHYLAIVLLPASFFAMALLIGFAPLTAAAVAVLSPLIANNALFGLDYHSFVWRGFGLFPQVVAANLLLLSIGFGYRAVREGRRVVLTGVLLGLTALAHLIYGYMGALTLSLVALMPAEIPRMRRIVRTVWIGLVAAVLSLFQLLPLWLDRAIINHSNTEPLYKWDSWGAGQVLAWLFTGNLLDYDRIPVLSLLALAGAGAIAWERRRAGRISPVHAFAVSGAVLWILLFFGRPFWGPLLYLAGVSPDMHLHRVIGGVHIFLILIAAVGLAALCRAARERWGVWAAAAALLIVSPAVLERIQFFEVNASSGQQSLAEYAKHEPDLSAVLQSIQQRGGRTYAGLWTNWGKMFNVSSIHIYSILAANRIPAVSYLIHTMALPADLLGGFNELRPVHYRLFDVRSVLTPAALSSSVPKFLAPRLKAGAFALFDAPGDGPFDVVDAPVVVPTDKTTFFRVNEPWLRSQWPEKKAHLWLDFFGDAPAGLPRLPADGSLPALSFPAAEPGRVLSVSRAGEAYQAEVEAARPSFALFKMTWHQDWKALVDGKPVKTAMLSPGFIGVPLTPGRHRVWCAYEPGNWKLPVGLAGLCCVLLLATLERFRALPGIQKELPRAQAGPELRAEPASAAAGKTERTRARKRRASVK